MSIEAQNRILSLRDAAALVDLSEARMRTLFDSDPRIGAYKDESGEWKIKAGDAIKLLQAREEGGGSERPTNGKKWYEVQLDAAGAQALREQGLEVREKAYYQSKKTPEQRAAEKAERKAALLAELNLQ